MRGQDWAHCINVVFKRQKWASVCIMGNLQVFFFFSFFLLLAKYEVMKGVRLQVDGFAVLVDPGHWNPLGRAANQVYGFLQEPNSLVNLIIDDGLVKIVCVCLLEDLGLFLQPL